MTNGKNKILRALAAMVLGFSTQCAPAFASPLLAQSDQSSDEKNLRSQVDGYTKAFALGDATAVANMWTTDGSYTDAAGRTFTTRAKIQQLFEAYFKQYGGQSLKISLDSVKFPAPNVAIEQGNCTVTDGGVPTSTARYIVVHVKTNGVWLMQSVNETSISNAPDYLDDLSWLVGDWLANGESPNTHLKATWDSGHHFVRVFSADSQQEAQVIGWNPATRQVVSWHFDTTGGFGFGKWLKSDNTWFESTSSVEPGGKTGHATYVLHKVDDNTFTWRSTRRNIDGVQLPDTTQVTFTRQK